MWYFTWVYLFDNFAVNIIFSCVLFYLNDLWVKNMDNGGEKICSLELNTSVKTQHINANLKSNIYTVKLNIRSKILFFIPYFLLVLINVKVLKTWCMLGDISSVMQILLFCDWWHNRLRLIRRSRFIIVYFFFVVVWLFLLIRMRRNQLQHKHTVEPRLHAAQ